MLYQLYRYCVCGNEVLLHSLAISQTVFETDWIIADDSIQKSFLLMMVRAQRPIELTAAKFVILSLETFMTVSIKLCTLQQINTKNLLWLTQLVPCLCLVWVIQEQEQTLFY